MNLPNSQELCQNVYVAGDWRSKLEIRKVQNELRKRGFNINHDWTIHEEPNEGSHEEKSKFAVWDINGVRQSDFIVVIPGRTGTKMEIGVALGMRIPIYLIGWKEDEFLSHLFFHHPLINHYNTLEEFLNDLDIHLNKETCIIRNLLRVF